MQIKRFALAVTVAAVLTLFGGCAAEVAAIPAGYAEPTSRTRKCCARGSAGSASALYPVLVCSSAVSAAAVR